MRLIIEYLKKSLPASLVQKLLAVKYWNYPEPLRTARIHSMLSTFGLLNLQELARRVNEQKIAGDFVECGVYRGGSAAILAWSVCEAVMPRKLYLCDAFSGMPSAHPIFDDNESHKLKGLYVGSEKNTEKIMKKLRIPASQYRIIRGWYEDTLKTIENGPIALLHIDCDFYESVKLCLDLFFDRVTCGGYIVIDDYGSYQGCRKAVDDFLAIHSNAILCQLDRYIYFIRKIS